MVFKRRDRRSVPRAILAFFWPKGGWTRAARYVKFRVTRLPDPPHRIARGIFAGVFVTFTPFFGLHFLLAAILSKLMRGNIVASLLATFVGNPLTFPAIAASSLQTGHFLLGTGGRVPMDTQHTLAEKILGAGADLRHNFVAMFTSDEAHWTRLAVFYSDVFLPYMVGAIIPGLICAIAAYYFSLPVLLVYQKRRQAKLKAKWIALKQKAAVDDAKASHSGGAE
ncbi:DUF2062 domain-containing protein [Pelagivirga sediminicola]|uniref:DUF2062 domain-containing protein n=1 Tax=Pelagivirga sediminicola TaxID=2170575 RepID=A0A2T7G928_9RHOB|nr:DUF2062 domain-containing protein [Pelagivirga sediminicola]PVA10911.1 DUF2062 domain-containing protein [Pelagivirga sediminicola]